ncbi:hypothetical protein [Limosilactobacillus fermentum]|nr:hypothetical protein [Limosilactobacillus fermentum]
MLDVTDLVDEYQTGDQMATRVASSDVLQQLAKANPQLVLGWSG